MLLCRYWLRFHIENSWWCFIWPDNTVHSNSVGTWKSVGRAAGKPESVDGSIEWQCRWAGCQWTTASSEETVSHSRWICLRCRCHCTSWPQSVFVLHCLPATLVVRVDQWSVLYVTVCVLMITFEWNDIWPRWLTWWFPFYQRSLSKWKFMVTRRNAVHWLTCASDGKTKYDTMVESRLKMETVNK